ncbi:hypothetical protein [Pectobacterium brasiliense]|uniref:hypothetical protein n=1 Tax=Pectobacterium brasiliense TaxID=180957 RepID=UPI001968D1B7|nr:hypothetical protein [Pectobacterium brasiliense]MBN3160359.1 hypothetical protein [Pectobacterium brasiliense]
MKSILLATLASSLFFSSWVNAEETKTAPENEAAVQEIIKVAIVNAKLTDSSEGCDCSYTIKNLASSPLKNFTASIVIKNEERLFRCDAGHINYKNPIQPNEYNVSTNLALGGSCGKNPKLTILFVQKCEYSDHSECSDENVDIRGSGLNWPE